MSAGEIAIVVVVVAVVVIVIAAAALVTASRRKRLQRQFGTEYDRTIDATGSRRKAEDELKARAERHDQLHIVDLSPSTRMQYRSQWDDTQTRFIDEPAQTMGEADQLVQHVMTDRGYPLGDFDQQTADLSVEHAGVMDHYRRAHEITESCKRGQASTEDLRQAMVHYRALFNDLLGNPDGTRDSDQVTTGQGGRNERRA
jgi:hypothetical protein